ncbi:MAG: DUF86 domain-containing protein [Phycisphaerales bacterium]|nr:MAG: DUF86 domain-containing protein [Phycisphaerales bacterium]
MPPERDDGAYIWDMLNAARAVSQFVAGRTIQDYAANLMLRSAVERQIEIIGEAARRVSTAFRAAHPQIPWRRIVGQRHVLDHDYAEIRHERLWRVAVDSIPDLIVELERLVPPPPPGPPDEL